MFLAEIKNKTTREVKEVIARVDPAINLPIDRVVYLSQDKVQLQMTVDKELLKQIEHLKSLISHKNINPSYDDLMKIMLSDSVVWTVRTRQFQWPPLLLDVSTTIRSSHSF